MTDDLDKALSSLLTTCSCPACERYRVFLRAEAGRVTRLVQASLLGLRVVE